MQQEDESQYNSEFSHIEKLKTYKASCIIAYDDKLITEEEKVFLDRLAEYLNLSQKEKNEIENAVFREQLNKERFIELYRHLYHKSLIDDQVINRDEQAILDSLRVDLNLSIEEQKQIENEVLKAFKEKRHDK